MKNFIAIKVSSRGKIHPEFKKIIKGARAFLLNVKSEIDTAEKNGESFSSLIDRYYGPLEKFQEKILMETDQIAGNFTDDEHLAHKDFLRDQLAVLFWQAPLHERALNKPLGYAGDFEMMNMLYDPDPFKGPTAYFKIINAVGCRCISGRATAARIPYFLDKFNRLSSETLKEKPVFQVLNLACGPSREVREFINQDPLSSRSEFHLVDQDSEAIRFSKKNLEETKRETASAIGLSYYDQPIQDFLADQELSLPTFDLIYSCGLFDYLDNDAFEAAVSALYGRLGKNGTMIIGNISPDDYSKTLKWYLDDWPLIYRDRDDLKKLAPSLPKPSWVQIESDETGINLFLVVTK